MEENEKPIERRAAMLSYIPHFYRTSSMLNAILGAEGTEFDTLRQKIDDLKAQFFIETATWGLDLWEREYGLTPNSSLSYEDRRSRVMGKMLGIGNVGVDLIKLVAKAYANGEVDVEFDEGITIIFVGTRGIPTALEELKNQLNEIVPAHLGVTYKFTYTTWLEVKAIPWSQVKTGTWGELKTRRVV